MVFTVPVLVYISFTSTGWMTFLPMMEAFLLIPLLELLFKPDPSNLSDEDEQSLMNASVYDYLIYLMVPIQIGFLIFFFHVITEAHLTPLDELGRLSAMGLMCAVFGSNVAH